jgi:magnesium transporter
VTLPGIGRAPARRKGVVFLLSIHKTMNGKMSRLDAIQDGCWVNLTNPSEDELSTVAATLNVEPTFLRAALDEEETSRVDTEEGQTLIIIDLPAVEKGDAVEYSTLPLGIIVTGKHIITVCLKESSILKDMQDGLVRGAETQKRTSFILYMLLQVAKRYLQYLKQIDKIYNYMERQLYKSQRNKELIQLLDLEKSLVYFNTSLKANEVTLEKILRGRIVTLYEEDHDLLEDVLIEVRQAIEMAQIYSSIISGMMDAFASVISNNLNVIMKVLTSITILLTIPNIIFGFYGMNIVTGLPLDRFWWIPLVIAGAAIAVVAVILKRKDLF